MIERMLGAMRAALSSLLETAAVTIAAVSGACLGGGAELAAACDVVFAAEDARIGFPEIRLACFPPGAVAFLPLRVGAARAADWILSGRTVSGREAADAGFASRAFPAETSSARRKASRRTASSRARRAFCAAPALRGPNAAGPEGAMARAEEAYRGLAGNADLARAVGSGRGLSPDRAGLTPDPAAAMIVYLNGEYLPRDQAKISPDDRGFLFADAIYEVVRFHRGNAPTTWRSTSSGCAKASRALRIDASPAFYPDVARRLLEENGLIDGDAIVYAQVSRGAAPRAHAFPPPGTPPTVYAFARRSDLAPAPGGGRAILVPDERWGRCDIKSVMLLPNVLAAQRAREAGAMDAIFVRDGFALEGTKANLFLASGGLLRTAPNGPHILPGVTRAAAIAAARTLKMSVEERSFTVEEMFAADEVFFASTTLWTYSLVEIAGRRIGDRRPRADRREADARPSTPSSPAGSAPRPSRRCRPARRRFP